MAKRKRLTPAAPREAAPPAAGARAPIAQVAGDAAARAALEEVTGAVNAARAEGRLIEALPLDRIETDHLVRDRLAAPAAAGAEDEDMAALKASLRARGQQTPIEVVALGADARGPRYGLISGWRRVAALRALAAEGAGEAATVLARVRAPAGAPEAYVAMVEENEIRAGLSYYERARIVVRAVEVGAFPDRQAALRTLFANVSRAKRSKIGSFAGLVDALDDVLVFPTRLGERAGLALAQALAANPALAGRIARTLRARPPATAEAEQAAIAGVLGWRPPAEAAPKPPAPAARRVGDVRLVHDPAAGRLTLTGPGVTEALALRLAEWLAGRDA